MNPLSQYLALLSEKIGDNEELKTALTDGFKAVQTAFDTSKERADKLGVKADELSKLNTLISSKLNIEEINEDNISEAISLLSKSKNDDIESLKTELATKHESDLETLRTELRGKEDVFNSLNSKYNDSLFKTSVLDSGLLDGFVDEPEARNMIIGKLKPQFIFDDGKIFVNDGNGEKAKNISTGEYLSPQSVVDNVKTTINPMYLTPQSNQGGGGTPPNNSNGGGGNKETIDASKYKDTGTFIKDAFASIEQK